jgi:hypothetical protein
MNKKIMLIWVIACLLLSSFSVFATSSCFKDESCNFLAVNLAENTTTANISIYLNSTNIITNPMTDLMGTFSFDYAFTEYGTYNVCVELFDVSGSLLDTKCDAYIVSEIKDSLGSSFEFMQIFVLSIVVVLLGISFLLKNAIMGIMGSLGLLFFGISIISVYLAMGIITIGFSLGLAIYFVFIET